MTMAETIETQPGKPCAICAKPATERYRPFCSKRCADVDLNRWLSGIYVVPATESEEDEKAAPPAAQEKS